MEPSRAAGFWVTDAVGADDRLSIVGTCLTTRGDYAFGWMLPPTTFWQEPAGK